MLFEAAAGVFFFHKKLMKRRHRKTLTRRETGGRAREGTGDAGGSEGEAKKGEDLLSSSNEEISTAKDVA